MFTVCTQMNTLRSYEYWPGLGHVMTVETWGRVLIRVLGIWYEANLPSNYGPMAYRKHTYIITPPRPFGYLTARSKADIDAEAALKAKIEAERLQEMREEAGWIEGYAYEEEEEKDFWTFFKQLKKETDERIQESIAMAENYMIARYDLH